MASETRTSIMAHSRVDGKKGEEKDTDNNQHVSKIESDSDGEYHEPGMRVGEEYQASIPELVTENKEEAKHDSTLRHNALLVWAPVEDIPNSKLDDYVTVAKDKHGYNVEQALGMLFWHKHNLDKSLTDLANFTPFPDEWSMEDKILFEQAYSSHGKSFKRIQQILPDKSVATLVKYYYSWKKTRSRTSLIDRQAKKMAVQKEPINDPESDNSDSSDSDFEPEKEARQANGQSKPKIMNKQPIGAATATNISGSCANCRTQANQLHATQRGNMCSACYQFYRRTGTLRPRHEGRETRAGHRGNKVKRKAPKGMVLSQEYLVSVSGTLGDNHVRPLEVDIVNLKRQIQTNKQEISQHKYTLDGGVETMRPGDQNNKNNARWSNDELLLAVQSVRRYGKDFQAMAEVLGNKSVSQCRNFFVNYRRRFNLQQVLEEYEAEQGITSSDRKDDDLQVLHMSGSPGSSGNSSPNQQDRSSPSIPNQGLPSQPPPLLKPSGSQAQRHPPPLQAQVGVPRTSQGGLQGPPPLIKPMVPPIRPQPLHPQANPMMRQSPPAHSHLIQQMMEQKPLGGPVGRSESPHSASGTPPLRQTRSGM
ncbi:REST corepressor 3 isoform X3 [Pocillopora verrucosa]|uniref:REST corepressor 3 isoform X3 n=1 Tax=Pocillopora verrucosa TaxID=203993 RepID=UPI002797494C|nr:REST corepressor 3-like isoform X3 [Pocillopora verrucosa]